MAFFECTVGNNKGNSLIVTCDSDFAGIAITCTNGAKTKIKVCPTVSPYTVTFTGLDAGTWTISATVDGVTYTTSAVIQDVSAVLNYGFAWKKWVDTSQNLDSDDYANLAALLLDKAALRELFLTHDCVDYMASTPNVTPDLDTVLNTDLAAKWLNLSDYALDTLSANAAIKTAMDSADKYFYGEWVITDNTTTPPTWAPKGNVPVMTSNTAPYGTVIFSKENGSNNKGYYAFDDNDATSWQTGTASGTTTDYIGYESTNPILVKKVKIKRASNSKAVAQSFVVEGYDGSSWTSISDTIAFLANEEEKEILTSSTNYYLGHRVRMTYNSASEVMSFKTLQFYGRELSVSVPKMATNTTPYGEASVDSATSSTSAYMAFDNNASDFWDAGGGKSKYWLQYAFTTSTVIKQFTYCSRSAISRIPSTIVLQGSNDGETFTPIKTVVPSQTVSDTSLQHFDCSENVTPYKIIRMELNLPDVTYTDVKIAQFYGLDYSEKEFEEGANKKWLYDHGVELESVTLRKGSDGTSKITQNADSIELFSGSTSSTSTTQYAVAMFNVDFSDYSLLRAKNGANYYGTSGKEPYVSIQNSDSAFPSNGIISWTPQIGVASIVTNMLPYNISLDVSAINATNWACYGAIYHQNAKCELTELWLE